MIQTMNFWGKNVQNQEKVPHDSDSKISLKNPQNHEKVPHPQQIQSSSF